MKPTERDETDELIALIKDMAHRIGAEFVTDPKKLAAFRRARHNQQRQG